jgi:signal transduction protein with GAF and PtsI domain
MVNDNNTVNELKKQILQLKDLIKIFFDLIQTTEVDLLLNKILKYAAQIMESDGASILLFNKEKEELYFKTSLGEKSQEIKKYKVKVGQGISGWVAEKGETLIVNDVNHDSQ